MFVSHGRETQYPYNNSAPILSEQPLLFFCFFKYNLLSELFAVFFELDLTGHKLFVLACPVYFARFFVSDLN